MIRDSFCRAYADLLLAHEDLMDQTNTRGSNLEDNMKLMTIDIYSLQVAGDKQQCSMWRNICDATDTLATNGTFTWDDFMNSTTLHQDTGCYLQQRHKRFLSFIGNAISNFFGLASTDDLYELEEIVGQIGEHAQHRHEEFKIFKGEMLISVLDIHWQCMNRFASAIIHTVSKLNQLHGTLNRFLMIEELKQGYNNWVHIIMLQTFMDVSVLQHAMMTYHGMI